MVPKGPTFFFFFFFFFFKKNTDGNLSMPVTRVAVPYREQFDEQRVPTTSICLRQCAYIELILV